MQTVDIIFRDVGPLFHPYYKSLWKIHVNVYVVFLRHAHAMQTYWVVSAAVSPTRLEAFCGIDPDDRRARVHGYLAFIAIGSRRTTVVSYVLRSSFEITSTRQQSVTGLNSTINCLRPNSNGIYKYRFIHIPSSCWSYAFLRVHIQCFPVQRNRVLANVRAGT